MKDARKTPKDQASAPGTGASILSPGVFPARHATVTADVLARLIAGERLTGLDAVVSASTTRLADVVHRLTKAHRWSIASTDKAAGCKDGRIAWVSEYSMAPEIRAAAIEAGADAWCADVRMARRALRGKAAQARAAALRFNAKRQSTGHRDPRQGDMFSGEGASA